MIALDWLLLSLFAETGFASFHSFSFAEPTHHNGLELPFCLWGRWSWLACDWTSQGRLKMFMVKTDNTCNRHTDRELETVILEEEKVTPESVEIGVNCSGWKWSTCVLEAMQFFNIWRAGHSPTCTEKSLPLHDTLPSTWTIPHSTALLICRMKSVSYDSLFPAGCESYLIQGAMFRNTVVCKMIFHLRINVLKCMQLCRKPASRDCGRYSNQKKLHQTECRHRLNAGVVQAVCISAAMTWRAGGRLSESESEDGPCTAACWFRVSPTDRSLIASDSCKTYQLVCHRICPRDGADDVSSREHCTKRFDGHWAGWHSTVSTCPKHSDNWEHLNAWCLNFESRWVWLRWATKYTAAKPNLKVFKALDLAG